MIRDKIAQFVSALSDRFVKRTLQIEGITSSETSKSGQLDIEKVFS